MFIQDAKYRALAYQSVEGKKLLYLVERNWLVWVDMLDRSRIGAHARTTPGTTPLGVPVFHPKARAALFIFVEAVWCLGVTGEPLPHTVGGDTQKALLRLDGTKIPYGFTLLDSWISPLWAQVLCSEKHVQD